MKLYIYDSNSLGFLYLTYSTTSNAYGITKSLDQAHYILSRTNALYLMGCANFFGFSLSVVNHDEATMLSILNA